MIIGYPDLFVMGRENGTEISETLQEFKVKTVSARFALMVHESAGFKAELVNFTGNEEEKKFASDFLNSSNACGEFISCQFATYLFTYVMVGDNNIKLREEKSKDCSDLYVFSKDKKITITTNGKLSEFVKLEEFEEDYDLEDMEKNPDQKVFIYIDRAGVERLYFYSNSIILV